MSVAARPPWARTHVVTSLDAAWPPADNDERERLIQADNRVEVAFYTTEHITATAKEKFGDDAAIQAKILSARKDPATNKVYIFYDRLLANASKTRVWVETICKEFGEMKTDCPRALRPFEPRVREYVRAVHDEVCCDKVDHKDDYEPLPGSGGFGGVAFDRWDEENLRPEHDWDMNESGIRVRWNEKFDPDTNGH